MKNTFTFCLLFFGAFSFAQIKALTDDGKEVILFENGNWKFVNESDAKVLESISRNENLFEKSPSATFLLKSKRLDVGIYIDPKKWKIIPQKLSPNVEYFFGEQTGDNSFYGFLMTEKIPIATLKNLKDMVLEQVKKNADYFRLKESEYRTINGLKVLYIRYLANSKGIDFEYIGNYYIDSTGYCSVMGFAPQKNFDAAFSQLQQLINGIAFSKKPEITEVIEYTSPPPPMKSKN